MQDPKIAKNSTSGYHCTTLSGYYLHNERTYQQSEKKLVKQQYLPHMSLQYGELRHSSVTAQHSSSGRQRNFAALNRERHLHSAGWPSRWALTNILVLLFYHFSSLTFLKLVTVFIFAPSDFKLTALTTPWAIKGADLFLSVTSPKIQQF